MSTKGNISKKRVVVSYLSLSPELKELFKKRYPLGAESSLIRVDKGNGEFLCGVVLETEEVNYFVKIAVKVDDPTEEEEDKDYYDDDIKGVEDLADDSEEEEE
ncbi:MAG: hypothetical protein RR388_07770 [Rikenellaceae bacterium]